MLDEASRIKDFPSLGNRIYFNSAAEGIPPLSVKAVSYTHLTLPTIYSV